MTAPVTGPGPQADTGPRRLPREASARAGISGAHYGEGVQQTAGPRAPGCVLVCLLLLGLVLMHHAPAAEHHMGAMGPPAATAAVTAGSTCPAGTPDCPMPGQAHDMLHLCLAVIGTLAGVLLLGAFLGLVRGIFASPRLSGDVPLPRVDRPPGWPGRTVLTSLCVLRL